MTPDIFTIEVTLRVTYPVGYETKELAATTIKDRAPWDDIKPTAIHRAFDAAIEDATARVEKQLEAEHLRRRAAEAAEAVETL